MLTDKPGKNIECLAVTEVESFSTNKMEDITQLFILHHILTNAPSPQKKTEVWIYLAQFKNFQCFALKKNEQFLSVLGLITSKRTQESS